MQWLGKRGSGFCITSSDEPEVMGASGMGGLRDMEGNLCSLWRREGLVSV